MTRRALCNSLLLIAVCVITLVTFGALDWLGATALAIVLFGWATTAEP